MPSHKSCKKRMRTAAISNSRNRAERSQMKKLIKDIRASKTKAEAQNLMKEVASVLDKAARNNIIHGNKAARDKSRLMTFIGKLS